MKGLEILLEEISEGPRAEQGNIGYNYQHLDNIYNYLSLMILKKSEYSTLCLPKYEVKYKKYILRSAIVYDAKDNVYWIPKTANKAISKCIKKKIKYILCSLDIIYGDEPLAHYNIMIIDLDKKTLERFEPYGWSLPYTRNVNDFIKFIVMKKLELSKFKYIPPENISEKLGIQAVADSYDGMCITIALLYLHLRIFNPEIKQKDIVKKLMSIPKTKLKKIILQYARYIEKKLKENPDYVNNLNYKLYRKLM
jgi:hypothetical protein